MIKSKVLGMGYLPDGIVKGFNLKTGLVIINEKTMEHIKMERHRSFDYNDIFMLLEPENIAYVGLTEDGALKIVSRLAIQDAKPYFVERFGKKITIATEYVAIIVRNTTVRTAYYVTPVHIKNQYERAEILPVDELFFVQ